MKISLCKKFVLPSVFFGFALTAKKIMAADIFNTMNNGYQSAIKYAYGNGSKVNVNPGTFLGGLIIILNQLLTFLAILFLLGVVYGGYLWMTARGKSEQVEKAKKITREVVIGLIIVFLARLFTEFILTQIGAFFSS